jgi:hypothetical protein
MRHDLSITLTIPNTSPIMAIIPILVLTQRVTAIKLSDALVPKLPRL